MFEPSDSYLAFWIQKYIECKNADQPIVTFRMTNFSLAEKIYALTYLNIFVTDIAVKEITPELKQEFGIQLVGRELTDEAKVLYLYIIDGKQFDPPQLFKAFSKFFHDFSKNIDQSLWEQLFACITFEYCVKTAEKELIKQHLHGLQVATETSKNTFSFDITRREIQDLLIKSEELYESYAVLHVDQFKQHIRDTYKVPDSVHIPLYEAIFRICNTGSLPIEVTKDCIKYQKLYIKNELFTFNDATEELFIGAKRAAIIKHAERKALLKILERNTHKKWHYKEVFEEQGNEETVEGVQLLENTIDRINADIEKQSQKKTFLQRRKQTIFVNPKHSA